jgi:glycosyltransferase involved in cell wall biosynthesis
VTALRLLWFGSYATGEGYPRSDLLMAGLRALGHDVAEVHAPLLEGAGHRVDAARGGAGAMSLAARQVAASWTLARGWFRAGPVDAVVVGYGGLVDVPLARLLQNFDRVPLVWDAFVPLYDALVRDRGLAKAGSVRARALLRLERTSARMADVVLADTAPNADLLAADLRVPRGRVAVVGIAQRDPGDPAPLPPAPPLEVLLVATHIPLHGVVTAIEAVRRLGADPGVRLRVLGTGQGLADAQRAAADVPAVVVDARFAPEQEVRGLYARSHVGLGVFGTTEKAARVVPLKAALTLAAGRALVTCDGPAARAALGEDALLVPAGDSDALAAALVRLRDDRAELERLAAAGRRRYLAAFTPEAAARQLLDAIARARR